MKHVFEFNDGTFREFSDGPILTYVLRVTPLGVQLMANHPITPDQSVAMMFPWSGLRMYSTTGDPAKLMVAAQQNGSPQT